MRIVLYADRAYIQSNATETEKDTAMKTRLAAALVASLLTSTAAGHAATINAMTHGGDVGIMISGKLVEGDADRFQQVRMSLTGPLKFVGLNSGGGLIGEAERIAASIYQNVQGVMTVVGDGNRCVSACFLILASGQTKLVSEGAQIGVHNANLDGGDNADGTVRMAKYASALGVPPSIIGRMTVTGSENIAWLSPDEIRSMGATVMPSDKVAVVAPASSGQIQQTASWRDVSCLDVLAGDDLGSRVPEAAQDYLVARHFRNYSGPSRYVDSAMAVYAHCRWHPEEPLKYAISHLLQQKGVSK
jgi:hypothetical protein